VGDHVAFDVPLVDIVAVDRHTRSATVLIPRDLILLEASDLQGLIAAGG
jgi:hypothetical protein